MSDNSDIVIELQDLVAAIRNLESVLDTSWDLTHTVTCNKCKRTIQGTDRRHQRFIELITDRKWTYGPKCLWLCPQCS